MILTARGIEALKRVGVELPSDRHVPVPCFPGAREADGSSRSGCTSSVPPFSLPPAPLRTGAPSGWFPLSASVIHVGTTDVEFQIPAKRGAATQAPVVSVNRALLSRLLMAEAMGRFSDLIQFHFNHR